MLRWFEYKQVYHPTREWDAAPDALGRPYEDIFFTSSDGIRLSAWFYPAEKLSPRAQFVIIVCHGNGGNISHRLDLARALLRTGANVFLFDYRGYGHSEGRLSEEGTYRDAQAAWQCARQKNFLPQNIIVFGESLGGAIATELAVRETIGGLILQSTFTSIPEIGAELFPWLPVKRLHSIKYDTLRKLPGVSVPVLIMHSRLDGLIGFHHAEKNFAAVKGTKIFWETEGDHNYSLKSAPDLCAEGVEKFLTLIETKVADQNKTER